LAQGSIPAIVKWPLTIIVPAAAAGLRAGRPGLARNGFFLSFPPSQMRNDTETFLHIPPLPGTGAMPGISPLIGW
jgi:hypothetical protein